MNTEDERITVTFYTGKENCFQISDMALKAMGNPTYAQVLINPITHQMLLMGTNEKRPNSILLQHRWAKYKNGKIVRGKMNLPSRGKDFFHCTVSRIFTAQ